MEQVNPLNHRTLDCGCHQVYMAPPVNGWVLMDLCTWHQRGRDDIAMGEVWPNEAAS